MKVSAGSTVGDESCCLARGLAAKPPISSWAAGREAAGRECLAGSGASAGHHGG